MLNEESTDRVYLALGAGVLENHPCSRARWRIPRFLHLYSSTHYFLSRISDLL